MPPAIRQHSLSQLPLATGTWRICALVLTVTAMAALLAQTARAQDNFGIDSYITPFPKNDIYQIRVVGDSLAAGLQYSIAETLGKDPRARVSKDRWSLKRITSKRFNRKVRDLRSSTYRENINVAILMVGAWDRRNLRDGNGKRLRTGSGDWRAEYGRRVDTVMKTMRAANVALYWVGLPPFRRGDANEDVQIINEIMRERAYLNGVKFIDAYAVFAGEQSAYAPYGPDLSGKIRLLRERDGIHLTYAGNQKLAHFIERAVMRDLDIARKERAIPLDGDVAAQDTVRKLADARQTKQPDNINWLTGAAEKPTDANQAEQTVGLGFLGGGRGGEQKQDNSRINLSTIDPRGREQIISVDIVRPAIPASVVALVTRKQREDKLTPMGDTLVDQINGGINIMSSVMPANQLAAGAGRRFSPAQTPFFRVLVKGEHVPPKAGRADDVAWPRPEPPPRQRLTRSRTPGQTGGRPGGAIDLSPDGNDGGIPLPGTNPFRPRV
ncbi:MAG: DUF459 domain-containing protein [Pseudomonadota bacterium]